MFFTKKGRGWPLSHIKSLVASQTASSPQQQHLPLNRKTSPNTAFLFTLSISPSFAQSFWLLPFVWSIFWRIKINKMKAFCRTFMYLFIYFIIWLSRSGCVAMCCLPWERETERKRGGCLPGDAGNKCTVGGLAEDGERRGVEGVGGVGGWGAMWPAPGSPHINTGRSQNTLPTRPTCTNTHTDVQTDRDCFVMRNHKKYSGKKKQRYVIMLKNAPPPNSTHTPQIHLEFHSFPNKSIPF